MNKTSIINLSILSMSAFKKIFTNLYLLFFLNGILVASIFYFKMESTYETELFISIVNKINADNIAEKNTDSFFLRAMDIANYLQRYRANVFADDDIDGWKAKLFHPVTIDLMTGQGSCGTASSILARILKSYNYEVRFVQMKVGNVWGGHIVIEVKKNKGWIVLDPLFRVYFNTPDGKLASFNDVHNNWEYYKKQVPKEYPLQYNYADVRYTNWDKIPVVGNISYKVFSLILGKEKADQISIRSYLLRNYHLLYIITLILFILTAVHTLVVLVQNK